MDDSKIVNLFLERDEEALKEAEKQYGKLCHYIANNILNSPLDAQECVNDTLLRAWNSIPPAKPKRLGAYLSKIARNLAIDKYKAEKSQKRSKNKDALPLDELEGCLSGTDSLIDEAILKDLINSFLRSLTKEKRIVFVQRYFYNASISEIAKSNDLTENNVKVMLLRLRNVFSEYIKKYGL